VCHFNLYVLNSRRKKGYGIASGQLPEIRQINGKTHIEVV
jgi:hypothetical protein